MGLVVQRHTVLGRTGGDVALLSTDPRFVAQHHRIEAAKKMESQGPSHSMFEFEMCLVERAFATRRAFSS